MNDQVKRRGRKPGKKQEDIGAEVAEIASSSDFSGVLSDMDVTAADFEGDIVDTEDFAPSIEETPPAETSRPAIAEKPSPYMELGCPPGWQPVLTAPRNGDRIIVSETGRDQLSVYWRVRRIINRKTLRYDKKGGWTSVLSRLDVDFEPKFWRPYNASEYIPVPRQA